MSRGARYPWWAPYLFLAPFAATFCVFTVYPLFESVVMACAAELSRKERRIVEVASLR